MENPLNSRAAHIELHLAVFLFGTAGLFGKWIPADPGVIVLGRSAFAAIAILVVLRLSKAGLTIAPGKPRAAMTLSGLVLALHWLTFFHAIQVSTVAIGLVGFASFPVFVTLLEPLVSGQRIRGVDIASMFVVVAGLLLVAPSFDLADSGTLGLTWAVVSGALFAVLALLNRYLVSGNPFMTVSFYQHGIAALVLVPFVIPGAGAPSGHTMGLLVLLGIVCTALPQTLFIKSLSALKAQLVSIVTGLEPVYGIALAALLLHEIPRLTTLLGAALIFTAVVLATRAHSGNEGTRRPH